MRLILYSTSLTNDKANFHKKAKVLNRSPYMFVYQMDTIVFDSDGLIKLTKSKVIEHISQKIMITPQVFNECVLRGKRGLHHDAFEIERLVKENKIHVEAIADLEDFPSFGSGELSALTLYKKIKAKAIVSDDKKFIGLLEQIGVLFIPPSEVVVALVEKKKISRKEGLDALERIKPYVNQQSYTNSKKGIGGIP